MGSTGAGAVTANEQPTSRARSSDVPVNVIAGCSASGIDPRRTRRRQHVRRRTGPTCARRSGPACHAPTSARPRDQVRQRVVGHREQHELRAADHLGDVEHRHARQQRRGALARRLRDRRHRHDRVARAAAARCRAPRRPGPRRRRRRPSRPGRVAGSGGHASAPRRAALATGVVGGRAVGPSGSLARARLGATRRRSEPRSRSAGSVGRRRSGQVVGVGAPTARIHCSGVADARAVRARAACSSRSAAATPASRWSTRGATGPGVECRTNDASPSRRWSGPCSSPRDWVRSCGTTSTLRQKPARPGHQRPVGHPRTRAVASPRGRPSARGAGHAVNPPSSSRPDERRRRASAAGSCDARGPAARARARSSPRRAWPTGCSTVSRCCSSPWP